MNWLWKPKTGDLVRFRPELQQGFPVRVPKPTARGYVKDTVRPEQVFIVLGELDFENKLQAAYAQEQQADLDPTGPDTHQSYFWALGKEGVIVLTRSSVVPV